MTTATTSTANRPTLWDIGIVASRLGVEPRHVRRLVSERRIPFIKWGRLLRFDPTEIEAWLDEARRPPAAGVLDAVASKPPSR
ncbi:MAG TPA: helix-turn-helix domain-containing protein [Acidimicrobiales bacterium]|nr:helix-turn-helix domain-containing protein [Acidimicrobiales bacterium]